MGQAQSFLPGPFLQFFEVFLQCSEQQLGRFTRKQFPAHLTFSIHPGITQVIEQQAECSRTPQPRRVTSQAFLSEIKFKFKDWYRAYAKLEQFLSSLG